MRNIFLSLAAILIASLIATLPTQIAFANEESDKHNLKGNELHNAGNYADAIKEYKQAIDLDSSNPVYYANIGWSYYFLKDYVNAEAYFKKAPNHFHAFIGLARLYRDQGKNDDAIKYFTKAGNEYYKQQNYTEAIKNFTDAINLGGGTAEVYDLRGWAYYNSENYDAAFEDFDKVIRELDSNYAEAYIGRAAVYLKQDNKEAAQKDFYQSGVIFYNRNNSEGWHTAITYFDEAIKLDGSESGTYRFSEADSYRLRGWAYHKLKLDDKALTDFNKAIEIFEKAITDKTIAPDEYWNCADTYNGRGWIYFEQKEYAKAESDFTKGIQRYEDYPYHFRGLAMVYKTQATNEPAKKTLAKENFTKAAELFYKRNEFPNAINDFTEAVNLDDKDPKLYYKRGLAYSAQGESENPDAALKDFTKAIEIFGKTYDYRKSTSDEYELYVESYRKRAEVYNKQGNNKSAADEDQKKANEIKPPVKNILEMLSVMLIGEKNELFEGLLVVILIEYLLTIVRYAMRERNLLGKIAVSHFGIIMLFLLIVFAVDKVIDSQIIPKMLINATIAIFLIWELLLIIDNAERLGLPVPEGLKEILRNIINKIRSFFGVGGGGSSGGSGSSGGGANR